MAEIATAQVLEEFPEFGGTSESVISRAIKEAYALTDVNSTITLWATAHILKLRAERIAGNERFGEIEESKVGPITTRHKTQALSERQVFFTRTEYGRHVIALESRNMKATVPVVIG